MSITEVKIVVLIVAASVIVMAHFFKGGWLYIRFCSKCSTYIHSFYPYQDSVGQAHSFYILILQMKEMSAH